MKRKTGARFEHATHELLPYLQLTELRGKLSNFIQIRTINDKSFKLFISKGSMAHNGEIPFPLKDSHYLIDCLLFKFRPKKVFYSYGDINISVKDDFSSVFVAYEQGGIFVVPHVL